MDLKKRKEEPEAMLKFLIVMCIAYVLYLLLLLYCGALIGYPDVSIKLKLSKTFIAVVFFSCFKKLKYMGDVLDSVFLSQFAILRSQLLDVFIIYLIN